MSSLAQYGIARRSVAYLPILPGPDEPTSRVSPAAAKARSNSICTFKWCATAESLSPLTPGANVFRGTTVRGMHFAGVTR